MRRISVFYDFIFLDLRRALQRCDSLFTSKGFTYNLLFQPRTSCWRYQVGDWHVDTSTNSWCHESCRSAFWSRDYRGNWSRRYEKRPSGLVWRYAVSVQPPGKNSIDQGWSEWKLTASNSSLDMDYCPVWWCLWPLFWYMAMRRAEPMVLLDDLFLLRGLAKWMCSAIRKNIVSITLTPQSSFRQWIESLLA